MASCLVFLLLVVIGSQFLLIMKLLHHKDPSSLLCAPEKVTSNPNSLFNIPPTVPLTTDELVRRGYPPLPLSSPSSPQQQQHYDGVAVSLLLHAPKWFQRRYTQMVQNVVNNIPKTWGVQIFYTPSGQSQMGIDLNKGLGRLISEGRVLLTAISPEVLKQRKKRFELMYHEWIWGNMVADRVLMFGGNSIMCSNTGQNISSYDEWDYVGAPWDFKKGVGGDGSISLRNRSVMLDVINYELAKYDDALERSVAYKKWGQDDVFFVSRILEMQKKGLLPNVKLAPREVTLKFAAIGSAWNEDVMVASGTLPGLSDDDRSKFISFCPDIKMVYPALHNPACFGAVPESDKCAASICALKPKTERKGGC